MLLKMDLRRLTALIYWMNPSVDQPIRAEDTLGRRIGTEAKREVETPRFGWLSGGRGHRVFGQSDRRAKRRGGARQKAEEERRTEGGIGGRSGVGRRKGGGGVGGEQERATWNMFLKSETQKERQRGRERDR